jgi:hypothetical protein
MCVEWKENVLWHVKNSKEAAPFGQIHTKSTSAYSRRLGTASEHSAYSRRLLTTPEHSAYSWRLLTTPRLLACVLL